MKFFLIIGVILAAFILGWVMASHQTGVSLFPKKNIDLNQTWSIEKQPSLQEELDSFSTMMLELEKKQIFKWDSSDILVFAKYLESLVRYVYANPVLLSQMTFPFANQNEGLLYIEKAFKNNETKNYGAISQILVSIYGLSKNTKTYSQQECVQFLEKQADLWVYFKDISNITYSKYRNSPLFNMRLPNVELSDLYNPAGLIWKDENEMSITTRVNRLLVSDFFFFQWVKEMTLSWIAEWINCDLSDEKSKPACLSLKKALLEKDKNFIVNKFKDNSRKYDLDSFYVRYLIGDLDKTSFIKQVCLVK